MKSAYERAMEKLEAAAGPSKSLTDEQRSRISEIDSQFDGRVAALRLGIDERTSQAASAQELEALQEELAAELRRLEEEREQAKSAIWSED